MPGESNESSMRELEPENNVSGEQLINFVKNLRKNTGKVVERPERYPPVDFSRLPNDRLVLKIIPPMYESIDSTLRQYNGRYKVIDPLHLLVLLPSLGKDFPHADINGAVAHLTRPINNGPELNPLGKNETTFISDSSLKDIGKILGHNIALVGLAGRKSRDLNPTSGDLSAERSRLDDLAPNTLRVLDTLIQGIKN